MFIQESPVDRLGFAPRRDVLLPYAGVLFATCRLVIDKVIDHFGLECEYRESWNGVVDRAAPWLHEHADSDQSL